MGLLILAAFIVIPITEIAVFIEVGGWLGLWPTIGLVLLTAIVGTGLLRAQGFATLMRAQQSLDEGRFPVAEVFDGLCLLLAGALLLTPGFVTDGVGLLLFVPALRNFLREKVGRYLLETGRVQMYANTPPPPGGQAPGTGPVIEGEFEELDEKRPPGTGSRGTDNPWNRDSS